MGFPKRASGVTGPNCPKCGTEVMVTGFTLISTQTRSYMRFDGLGPVLIASAMTPAEQARCMACDAALPLKPVELMRLA